MNDPQRLPPLDQEGSGSPAFIPFIVAVVVLIITAIVFAIKQRQLGNAVHERNVLLEDKKQQDLAIKEEVERKKIDEAVAEVLKIEDRIKRLNRKIVDVRLVHVDLEAQLDKVKSWSDLEIQ